MTRIADTDIDVLSVLESLNMIILNQRNSWGDLLCPFHVESKSSFSINLDSGVWVCRHDSSSGSLIDLVAYCKQIERTDSIIWLRGFKPKPNTAYDLLRKLMRTDIGDRSEALINEMAEFDSLSTRTMSDYFFERGFSVQTMHQFDVRYNEEKKHLIWPIKDENANVVGFIKRFLPGRNPKYEYISGFKRCLFPMDQFIGYAAILVEGPLDAMWLHQNHFPNALAMLGSGLTVSQLDWLQKKVLRVVIIPDNDDAGERATRQLIKQLDTFSVDIATVPPQYKDIQEVPFEELISVINDKKTAFEV